MFYNTFSQQFYYFTDYQIGSKESFLIHPAKSELRRTLYH